MRVVVVSINHPRRETGKFDNICVQFETAIHHRQLRLTVDLPYPVVLQTLEEVSYARYIDVRLTSKHQLGMVTTIDVLTTFERFVS